MTLKQASHSTVANVAQSASSGLILAMNSARRGCVIYNDASVALYVLLAPGTASTSNFSDKLAAGGTLYLSPLEYTGEINGIWASGTGGFARVTEFV